MCLALCMLLWVTRPWGMYPRGYLIESLEESRMCVPATCPSCRKVTWSGCGMHVDQVMARVPGDQR